jgi:hypothetical protein
MYILVDQQSGGVYAVKDDKTSERVVQLFEQEDDANRYAGLLKSNTNEYDDLEVHEVDVDLVLSNCNMYGYDYCIITPEDIVFPP